MSASITITRDISSILAWLTTGYTETDGRVSWPSGDLDEHTFALMASLTFAPKIDDHEKDSAIWRTVNDCAKAKIFSQAFFLKCLKENVNAIRSMPNQPFSIVAQLNFPRHGSLPRTISSVYGTVALSRHLNSWERKYMEGQKAYEKERLQLDDEFVFLRHNIQARSARTAIDTGYRNLQCCVGILNLCARGFGLSHRSGMPDVPLGKLLLASTALLIDQKKRTVGDWLVESHFPHLFRRSFTASSVNLEDLPIYTRRWVRQIKATDFADRITTAIILFQEGLSANQVDVALIKFWTCIELLCARPDQKEPLDRAIERASSIFTPPEATLLRLRFIAESRHAVVHRGENGDHSLLCAQWASIYAAELIGFCAFNSHDLRKHSEILDYLSTPRSTDRIEEIIRIHRLRLKQLRARKRKTENASVEKVR